MNRSAPIVPLRGSAPSLLQVQIPELLRRPLGQLALVNVLDLVELSSTEGRPKALDKELQAFVGNVRRQVEDIPNGRPFEAFLDDLGQIAPELVPRAFRELVEASTSAPGRGDHATRIAALSERWAGVEPQAFDVGSRTVRIQKAEETRPRPAAEPSSSPRERASRAAAEPRERAQKPAAAPRPRPVLDVERREFVVRQCVERLSRCTSDRGLAETVLVAGVRHAGRETYPDLTPLEITGVLKQLKEKNQVRYSAGRWSVPTTY